MEKSYRLRAAEIKDEKRIRELIALFELDGAGFEIQQFIIAEKNGEIKGIGRVREHVDCSKACTLGILHEERKKGLALALMKDMIQKAQRKDSLYLVCIIPEFFYPLGFEIVNEPWPEKIKEKLHPTIAT